MKPAAAIALFIFSFVYLLAAIPGMPRGTAHHIAGDTAVPPRLFANGEVAINAATHKKVVVQSAAWDKACHCYIYTVTPYK